MKSLLFTALLVFSLLPISAQDNWPGFRGPSRQGMASGPDLPLKWNATENVKWKTAVPGEGWSSPIVWGHDVFLTTTEDKGVSCRVLCYDAATGALKWNTEVFKQATPRKENRNSYATPTPVTDGKRVYAVFGGGGIAAVDYSGKTAWTFTDFHFYSRHGLGASPVLEDGILVMPWDWSTDPDKEGIDKEKVGWQIPWDRSFVFALDAATGKLAWKTARGPSRIAHITPNIWTDETGRKQVVSGAGDVLQGFDLKTGERLWSAKNEGEGVTPSVVIADGLAVQSNGWGGYDSVRAFKLAGAKGDVSESAFAWEQKKNAPKLPSMVYVAPHLFCITEGGMAWCAKADTGEILYRERIGGTFASSPVVSGNRIYITDDQGETTVLPATPKFEILAKNPIGEKVQASPAVSGGRLFIRGGKDFVLRRKLSQLSPVAKRMKSPKYNWRFIILTAVLLVFTGKIFGSWNGRDKRLKSQAAPFIAAAESHYTRYGEYPDSLPIPTTPEHPDGELFYQRGTDGSYIIWYGTTLGESTIYYS